jgi:hypothetical protein
MNKLFTTATAILLLCTMHTQAQTNKTLTQQQLMQSHKRFGHAIAARQLARRAAVNSTAAKTTDMSERIIAYYLISAYTGEAGDSFLCTYSGNRSSRFDFNDMQYHFANYFLFMYSPENAPNTYNEPYYPQNPDVLFDSCTYFGGNINGQGLLIATYDANNNLTQYYNPYQQDSLDYSVTDEKTINTYDANQNLTSSLYINWANAAWDTSYKRTITYNSNIVATDSLSKYINGAWVPQFSWSYTYDNNGNLTNATSSPLSSTSLGALQYRFFYNADNTLQKDSIFTYGGPNIWIIEFADSMGYTPGVNFITYESSLWYPTNGIQFDSVIHKDHITGGLPDTVYDVEWNSSHVISNGIATVYTYDSYNNPLVGNRYQYGILSGSYDSTVFSIARYYYQQFTTAVKNVAAPTANITIYPNPATNEINIAQTGIQQGTHTYITLINALGQTVLSETLPSMSSTEALSVAGIAPGNYWVVVQDPSGNILGRKQIIKE